MSIRRGRRVFQVAAVAAALLAPLVPQAANASGFQGCPPGSICGWSGPYYSGAMVQLPLGAGCVQPAFPIRSAVNTVGSPGIPAVAAFYASTGCTGLYVGGVGPTQSAPAISPAALSVMLVW
ncbi:peptidase inhibitor family I36 protein [Streptosporangium sp. NPDC051023]|uniref:peptidase inhibitor family I36 protein n=1 Tax=Streptosporangium sp. NPDC051023 TaxID=3155410 RepID=UPI00344FF28E